MSETTTGGRAEGGAPGPARWRKKPVEVQAVQWTGDNADEIFEFAGCDHFDVLDEPDRANSDDPEATAAVFDKLHSTWVLVKDGQWIIRGVKGEFCPCDDEVFAATYEPADGPDRLADVEGEMGGAVRLAQTWAVMPGTITYADAARFMLDALGYGPGGQT